MKTNKQLIWKNSHAYKTWNPLYQTWNARKPNAMPVWSVKRWKGLKAWHQCGYSERDCKYFNKPFVLLITRCGIRELWRCDKYNTKSGITSCNTKLKFCKTLFSVQEINSDE